MGVHRATVRQWRLNNSVPPNRIDEFAAIAEVPPSEVPTETDSRPGAEVSYKSLYAMPEEFRTRLGQIVPNCDQITLLGLSGPFPLEHLPYFKEQVTVAAGLTALGSECSSATPKAKH